MKSGILYFTAIALISSASVAGSYPEKSRPGNFQNNVAPTVMNAPAKEEAAPVKAKKPVKKAAKPAKKDAVKKHTK